MARFPRRVLRVAMPRTIHWSVSTKSQTAAPMWSSRPRRAAPTALSGAVRRRRGVGESSGKAKSRVLRRGEEATSGGHGLVHVGHDFEDGVESGDFKDGADAVGEADQDQGG